MTVTNVEDALSFFASLNGQPVDVDFDGGDLVVSLANGDRLWANFGTAGGDERDTGADLADAEQTGWRALEVIDWCAEAVAYGHGLPPGGTWPHGLYAEVVELATAVDEALFHLEGWLWQVAVAAARGMPHDPPCGCPAALDPEHGDLHTARDHRRTSCSRNPHCGGCYDCLAMQLAHYERVADAVIDTAGVSS